MVAIDGYPMPTLVLVCWSVCAGGFKRTSVGRIHIKLAVDEGHG